jgi:hypothetical protein
MKSILKYTALLLVIITTSSCVITGTKGNNQIVTQERKLNKSFDGIDVSQGINVFLTQGNEENISVETDENIQEILITKVNNNNILEVYFDENVRKVATKNVYITAKNIHFLDTSSGASITAEEAIKTATLELKSSSGSSIRVEVVSNLATAKASSGSSIKIIGKTNSFNAKASSGSTIRADRFESSEVEAKVSSGASIDVNAKNLLVASASSGGSIDYEGNPKKLVKNTSSGGNVHKN